jgi:hypothetical protein
VSQEAPGVASLASNAAGTSAANGVGILLAALPACACGCGRLLSGRQTKYASKDCANRIYETARPRILNASAGAPREGTILAGLVALMADGEWWDVHRLAAELKALPCSVSARIREARSKGFRVERDLKRGNVARPHRYRLLLNGATDGR